MEARIILKGPIYAAMKRELGWQDICAIYKIKNSENQHKVRCYVMSQGKHKASPFNLQEWRKVSGYA